MDNELNTMQASEDFLRTMIEKIPMLAWSCRPDGTAEFQLTMDRLHGSIGGGGPRLGMEVFDSSRRFGKIDGHLVATPGFRRAGRGGSAPATLRLERNLETSTRKHSNY